MTAEQFRNALIRRWWLIVTCTLCAGIGAFLGSLLLTPLYESTAVLEVQIGLTNNAVVVTQLADKYINSDAQLATSTTVLAAVAPQYVGLSVDQLKHEVSASAVSNTQLLQISVLDPSPPRAAALANDVAAALIAQQQASQQAQRDESQRPILARVASYQQLINTLRAQLRGLAPTPQNAGQIADLKTQLADAQNGYTQWQQELSRVAEAEAMSSVSLQVADPAQPGSRPVRPSVVANVAAGLLFGMMLGVLLVVLRAQVDQRIGSAAAVGELLGWPVLAEIGPLPSVRPRSQRGSAPHEQPQANQDPYHTLSMALQFLSIDKPLRTLVVTSATAADGSSAVAADWALFLASAGKQVLLVDANLRHPSQAARFGVAADPGLSNAALAFSQPDPANEAVHQFLYPATNRGPSPLMIMPAGTLPPNPSDVLKSRAMGHLYAALLTSGADIVIFDAPPAPESLDARILAMNADGVLVVVDRSRVRRGQLARVKALLTQAGANVLGSVVVDANLAQPLDATQPGRHGQPSAEGESQTPRVYRAPPAGPLIGGPEIDDLTAPPAIDSATSPPVAEMAGGTPPGETMPYG